MNLERWTQPTRRETCGGILATSRVRARRFLVRGSVCGVLLTMMLTSAVGAEIQLDTLGLPDGFEISLYAEGVEGARSLAVSSNGTVYVGSMRPGKVYALVDADNDGVADKTHIVAEGLYQPNGVAWRDGSLYVAEINRVTRFDSIDQKLESPPEPAVVLEGLPSERHHGWKFIAFGPDGKLYLPVGAPCNICEPELPFAAIHRLNPDGSEFEVYVRGVRQTVGFDWHPVTGEMWFTDNGRDMMGDDIPPDELNRVTEMGQHFGYPYCHGKSIADPEFGDQRSCSEIQGAEVEFEAHVAAIGMRFYTGEMFPPQYRHRIFLAQHGSWNRSSKIGYRVMQVGFDAEGKAQPAEVFVDGWLQDGKQWGRPADVLVMPDGALLISDDQAGAIYRVAYTAGAGSASSGRPASSSDGR